MPCSLSVLIALVVSVALTSCGKGKTVEANTTLANGPVSVGVQTPSTSPTPNPVSSSTPTPTPGEGGSVTKVGVVSTPTPTPAPKPVSVSTPTPAPTVAPQAAGDTLITCAKEGNSAASTNTLYFVGADCTGGKLPDANYVGIPSRINATGGTSGEFAIGQPITGDPAYVTFFAGAAGTYAIQVVYLRSSLAKIVSCVKRGAITQNNMRIDYQPTDCSGGRLPDSNYLASLGHYYVNNGSIAGYRVGQPVNGQAAGVSFYANQTGGQYAIRVMYLLAKPGPVVTCSKNATTVLGLNTPAYVAANCDAGRLPIAASIGFQAALQVANGYRGNVFIHQPFLDGAAQTNFQSIVGGSNYAVQTVYGELY